MKLYFFTLIYPLTIFLLCKVGVYNTPPNPADVIYYNGNIITMEGDSPQYVEAIATKGERILDVGSMKRIFALQADSTQFIDLQGKTLLPGFIDPHIHPILATIIFQTEILAFNDWDLPHKRIKGILSPGEYEAALKASVHEFNDVGRPFVTWGYHNLYHGDITRGDLDEWFPETPVVLWQYSFHEVIINTKGLEMLGIEEPSIASHPHVVWDEGRFFETGLALIAAPRILRFLLNPASAMKGMSLVVESVEKGGITTIGDMAVPMVNFDLETNLLLGVLSHRNTRFRTFLVPNAALIAQDTANLERDFSIIDDLRTKNTDKVKFLPHVKLFADGAFYAQLMQMKEGYTDGHHGAWLMEPPVLEKYMKFFWDKRYRIHVHANGDLGIEKTLEFFERIKDRDPYDQHGFTLHHVGYTSEDQVRRMAANDIQISAQPYYLYAIGSKYAEVGLGSERAQSISPVGLMIDEGIVTSLHSDFFMAPSDPLTLMWAAVNRKTIDGKTFGRELKIPVYEALKCVTINAAKHLDQDARIGTLSKGKYADFVILNTNPLAIDPEEIIDINVVETIFSGQRRDEN